MVFIETLVFTKQITALLGDEDYQLLQNHLINNPEAGKIIQKSGGCRKVRWQSDNNKGKSSGVRVIYYYIDKNDQIAMLLAYPKSEMDNLSDKQLAMLKIIVKEQFHA